MRENCKSSLLVARSISCRRRSHANCCIKVKNLQLQHQLHSHTRGHRHAYKCVASLSQRSSSRQWQRHLSVHTRTHGYHAASHASLSSSPLHPPPLSVVYHAKVLIFAQRTSHRIASHRMSFFCPSTYVCLLTDWLWIWICL